MEWRFKRICPVYPTLDFTLSRGSSTHVSWTYVGDLATGELQGLMYVPQGSIYTLSSSEQALFANYGRYIKCFESSVYADMYAGVELRFCWDWEDDDPDTGGSGHEEIVIWSETIGHEDPGSEYSWGWVNTTQVRIDVNTNIYYRNYRTNVYFKLTKSRCIPLGVTVLS